MHIRTAHAYLFRTRNDRSFLMGHHPDHYIADAYEKGSTKGWGPEEYQRVEDYYESGSSGDEWQSGGSGDDEYYQDLNSDPVYNPFNDPFAVGTALGSLQLAGTIATNEAARDAAKKKRKFQEYMSNTAYQRGTADMRLAGINPILAYQQGGASTPQGASPQLFNPDIGKTMGAGITAAAGKKAQTEQAKSLKTKRQVDVASLRNLNRNAALTAAQTERTWIESDGQRIRNDIDRLGIPAAENEKAVSESALGEFSAYVRRIGSSVGSLIPGFGLLVGGGRARSRGITPLKPGKSQSRQSKAKSSRPAGSRGQYKTTKQRRSSISKQSHVPYGGRRRDTTRQD